MKGFKRRTPALLLAFCLLVTTFSIGGGSVFGESAGAARDPWGGAFNPQSALDVQKPFDANKYYVWYNGKINTMADPDEFDYGTYGADGKHDRRAGEITSDSGKIETYLEVSALVARDQFIEYAGNDVAGWAVDEDIVAEIGTAAAPGTNAVWIDLKGATVIPGLIDSHTHFVGVGTARIRIDIFWKPKAEIVRLVAEEVLRTEPGGWVVAGGWLQTLPDWDPIGGRDSWPTKWDLDPISPTTPVWLSHASGHARWGNSAAMATIRWTNSEGETIIGIDNDPSGEKTPNPAGGEIIRNEAGEAIGVFTGNARAMASPPGSGTQQTIDSIYAAQDEHFQYGLTTAMDAGSGVSSVRRLDEAYRGELKRLDGTSYPPLKIRLYQYIRGESGGVWEDIRFRTQVDEIAALSGQPVDEFKRAIGWHGNRYTLRGIKTQLDGALGARSAHMIEDYSDRPGHPGAYYTEPPLQKELMDRNIRAGFQVTCHTIGDRGNKTLIDLYEEILGEIEADAVAAATAGNAEEAAKLRALVKDDRLRSEHFQIVRPVDITRAVNHGMALSMQFVHGTSDMAAAEDRVGPDRILGAYAWRTAVDQGGIIGNGTDASVELLNPYHGLYAGVTRVGRFMNVGRPDNASDMARFKAEFIPGTKNFTADSGWYPAQKLTRAEALHYHTWGGAWCNFEENIKGVLREGYLADFVVLDRDYFDDANCWDWEIKDLNAVMTVLGSEIVYTMGAPVVTTNLTALATHGVPYSMTLSASGTENFVWSIVDADPELAWLSIDEYRGRLNGVPTVPGTYNFTVAAENYNGADTKTLELIVGYGDVPPVVYASVDAKDSAHFQDGAEFTLALKEAVNVLAVDVEFVVDGAMLAASSFETLNGFSTLEEIKWTDNGDGTWAGAVRFGYTPPGSSLGFSCTDYTDVAKFFFTSQGVMGDALFEITKIEITGHDKYANVGFGGVVFFDVIVEKGSASTVFFNKYDLDKDGKVNLVDLGIMLLYVGFNQDDPEWDTLVKTYDVNRNPITPSTCDVNGDGEVDMADLIELMANFGLAS